MQTMLHLVGLLTVGILLFAILLLLVSGGVLAYFVAMVIYGHFWKRGPFAPWK